MNQPGAPFSLTIKFRPASMLDAETLLGWRYEYAGATEISYGAHIDWLRSMLNANHLYMVNYEGQDIGVIGLPHYGLFDRSWRGVGLGQALRTMLTLREAKQ